MKSAVNCKGDQSPDNGACLSEHLITLSQGQWALWRWAALRGAGFPMADVLRLSVSSCAQIANQLIQAEDRAEELWALAVEALERNISEANTDERPVLIKTLRALRKGKPRTGPTLNSSADGLVNAFQAACTSVDSIWAQYATEFEEAEVIISREIQRIIGIDRFREAIVWQNRNALHTGIDEHLLAQVQTISDITGKRRKREELVANYWQRYCTKNDSIGFFGPVGWLRLNSDIDGMLARPGQELIARRNIYFEVWCIRALAARLSEERNLRLWMPPCLSPVVHFDGNVVSIPLKEEFQPCIQEASIIRLCDGNRSALQIASELLRNPAFGFEREEQVYDQLESLAERKIVSWGFQIPASPHPELVLLRLIEKIGDESLRTYALRAMSELEAAKTQVAEAAGDAEKLDAAMAHLEHTFSSLTGAPATRQQGLTYAGRTLVYEDCVRDIDLQIGNNIVAQLGPPLSLLLSSARWLTAQAAARFRAAFQLLFDELRTQSPSAPISSSLFWARAQSRLFGSHCDLVDSLLADFQHRWANVLSIDPSAQRVDFTSNQLALAVESQFKGEGAGWNYARYHSPDIMIAAPGVDAINRGEFVFVLGELHVAINTLSRSLFVCQHPDSQQLYQALDRDQPQPLIVPVPPKHAHSSRGALMLVSDKDYRLEIDADTPSAEKGKSLPIGSLVVDDIGDGVFVRSIDNSSHFDIIEIFADFLTSRVMNNLKILAPSSHNPRLTIDRLVVCRETWRVPVSDLDFALEKDPAHRFLAARRWAGKLGLPRFLFFKSPLEVKPCFLDLDSPIFINIFSRIVRRTLQAGSPSADSSSITLSEMLPAPDQLWLPDSLGNLYSSELRLIAVDLAS